MICFLAASPSVMWAHLLILFVCKARMQLTALVKITGCTHTRYCLCIVYGVVGFACPGAVGGAMVNSYFEKLVLFGHGVMPLLLHSEHAGDLGTPLLPKS